MKEQLKNVTGEPINRVAVGLTSSANKKETTITSIEVVMGGNLQTQSEPIVQTEQTEQSERTEQSEQSESLKVTGQAIQNSTPEKIQSIEIPAVKQIEIDVSSSQNDENAGEHKKEQQHNNSLAVEQNQGNHDEKIKQMSSKIKDFLQEQWGIQRDIVSVEIDELNFKE
jgi:hypothetical protein